MNMAIDEVLLESVLSGRSAPVLRVYKFEPAAVTLGLSQKLAKDVVDSIRERGIDVVRRPTGGRAVLHKDDLTYAFIAPDISLSGGFLNTGVTESYKQICQGLIAAFSELGIESELGATGVSYRHLQDCFMATTNSDLHHNGVKLIGSAQVRRKGGVLQHGSVPLSQEHGLMAQLLSEESKEHPRHVNLFELIESEVDTHELERAFTAGFEKAFDAQFEKSELTEAEVELIGSIAEKYSPAALDAIYLNA